MELSVKRKVNVIVSYEKMEVEEETVSYYFFLDSKSHCVFEHPST